MAISKPIALDETLQAVNTTLQGVKTALENQAGSGSSVDIVTSWQSTPDNSHVPSEKLVKDNLDLKANQSTTYTKSEVDTKLSAIGGANGDLTPDANRTRNIGSKDKQYLELFVKYLALGGYRCDSVGLHNGLYRGACLYDAVSSTAGVFSSIEDIHTAVSAGDFSDIYIGDYILVTISTTYTSSETVKLMVAGIDYYLHRGGTEVTSHHIVLVPENCFTAYASMNSSSSTSGGYKSSAMQGTVLPKYATALNTALGSHLLSLPFRFSSTVNTSYSNDNGGALTGASSAWSDVTTNISLMTETQVYGVAMYSNLFDQGYVPQQLPLFRLRPDLIPCGLGHNASSRYVWWLSGVAGSSYFCSVTNYGYATCNGASNVFGVRPLIVFA